MSTRRYRRDILALLKRDYGVRDARVEPGGNHAHCRFTYGGVERTLTLAGSPNKDFQNAFNLKRQDIRRLLGPPVDILTPPPRRRLDEMLAPLAVLYNPQIGETPVTEPTKTYETIVACYHPERSTMAPRLRIRLPKELIFLFPGGVDVERIDATSWALRPVAIGSRRIDKNDSVQFALRELTQGLEPFAASPATAMVIDGAVVVDCPVETRKAPYARDERTTANEVTSENVVSAVEVRTPVEPSLSATVRFGLNEDYMKGALAMIRRVEAETPFRLVKGKESGTWTFVARVE